MDQKKIGKYIKELRIKNNLSQTQLAEKLSVTSQAISKWENGRGIPDIEMLKQLSIIFNVNIDELINGEKRTNKNKFHYLLVPLLVIVIILTSVSVLLIKQPDDNFKFNTIASDNDKFSIKGVIAYNNNKKSIYISDIKYSAPDNDEEEYVVAECILYEVNENTEKKISQCGDISKHQSFSKNNSNTLTNLLKDVEFNVDNYDCSCGKDNCNNLYLKVNAINTNNKTITYNIPIQIDNKCAK